MTDKIDRLKAKFEKVYGKGILTRASDIEPIKRISFGIYALDYNSGGGLPKGRFTLLWGKESSGKTYVAYSTTAQLQKSDANAIVLWVDTEHSFDPIWATKIGVDLERVVVVGPETGETVGNLIHDLLNEGVIQLVVIDSIESTVPLGELEQNLDKNAKIGVKAKLVNSILRRTIPYLRDNKLAVILINQIRMKVGVMFGSPETMSGGEGQKYFSSITMRFGKKSNLIEKTEGEKSIVGQEVSFDFRKNKTAPPFRAGVFDLYFSANKRNVPIGSVDNAKTLRVFGLREKILKLEARTIVYGRKRFGSTGKFETWLRENPREMEKLNQKIRKVLFHEDEKESSKPSRKSKPARKKKRKSFVLETKAGKRRVVSNSEDG